MLGMSSGDRAGLPKPCLTMSPWAKRRV